MRRGERVRCQVTREVAHEPFVWTERTPVATHVDHTSATVRDNIDFPLFIELTRLMILCGAIILLEKTFKSIPTGTFVDNVAGYEDQKHFLEVFLRMPFIRERNCGDYHLGIFFLGNKFL